MRKYVRDYIEKAQKFTVSELKEYEELVRYLEARALKVEKKYEEYGLKIIAFADTHGCFAKREVFEEFIYEHANYDICLLLGDHIPEDVDMILQYVPDYKIFGVLGNHDKPDLYERFNINDISGKTVSASGITIAGMEGTFRYKQVDRPMMTQYESLKMAYEMIETMPEADILVSHDKAFKTAEYDTAHTGLIGITTYLYLNSPALHLHGHMHAPFDGRYCNEARECCVFEGAYIEL